MYLTTWTYAVFQGSHDISEISWTCLSRNFNIFSFIKWHGHFRKDQKLIVISPVQHETLNQVCSQNLHQSSYRTKQIPQLCQHLLHPSCPSKREKAKNPLKSTFKKYTTQNDEWKHTHTNSARAAAAQKENRVSISPVKMSNWNHWQNIYTTQ